MISTPRRLAALGLPAVPPGSSDVLARRAMLSQIARLATVTALVVAALLFAGIIGLSLYAYSHSGRVYEGVKVGDVSVGGMSREEASAAIQARYDDYANVPLSVVAEGVVFTMTPAEAGARLNRDASVDAALSYGREGSVWERSSDWARGLLRGVSLSPHIVIDSQALDGQLRTISSEIDREPENASVEMGATGGPELVADTDGLSLVIDESRHSMITQFARLSTDTIQLPTAVVQADITATSLTDGVPAAQQAVSAPLVLASAEQSWTVPPDALKEIVSVDASGALAVDRDALGEIIASAASEVDREAVNTGIEIGEDGSLTIVPGSFSAVVNQSETLDRAVDALTSGEHSVRVAIDRAEPAITDAEATAGVAAAEALIGEGILLTWKDTEARLERADLARALVIEPRPDEERAFAVSVNPDALAEVLFPVAVEIDVPVRNASFRLIDGVVTLVDKEKRGRATDMTASVETVITALNDGDESAELSVVNVDPDVRASELDSISVPDILGDSFTYYGNSSEPRRQNVERAIDLETGWLVAPGEVFSYVDHIGDIDKKSGFATGFGIVADGDTGDVTTAPVIGGGICQVSTTIFQAAFWAGLAIEERWQHPYWLTSYGQPPRGMKGLDAMVNVEEDWALDMKFRNTTENWIAVLVMYDSQNVTAQILGTDPGWDVSVSEPVISNVVPKDDKMYFTESPELPAGQEMLVESAAEGFDTEITRVVSKDGEVLDHYVMTSSFAPSRNTTLRGTGQG